MQLEHLENLPARPYFLQQTMSRLSSAATRSAGVSRAPEEETSHSQGNGPHARHRSRLVSYDQMLIGQTVAGVTFKRRKDMSQ